MDPVKVSILLPLRVLRIFSGKINPRHEQFRRQQYAPAQGKVPNMSRARKRESYHK
jgi:hypothetical protein